VRQGLVETLLTAKQFGQFLPAAEILGEGFDQLLILADRPGNLALGQEFLGAFEKLVFMRQGQRPDR